MIQRKLVLTVALSAIAACTYNEYQNTYNQVAPDAGAPVSRAGSGGSSGSGGSGGANQGGSAGTIQGGSGGGDANASCTGCLQLSMPANPGRAVGLAFGDEQDLSQTRVEWRVRVRDFTETVTLGLFAESGNDEEERLFLGNFQLAAADGWQTFGADFANLSSFQAPSFVDAGDGAGGGGFDSGFPFDKSEVERIAMTFGTNVQSGVFTPLVIEIDSIRFSDRSALDRDFGANAGGVELITLFDEPVEGAVLLNVLE
jgi:hypothetical protein